MAEEKTSKLKNLLLGNQDVMSLIPGVIVAVVLMIAAEYLTRLIGGILPFKKNPVSAILVAIILGLAAGNMLPLQISCGAGIKFGLTKMLRLGIMLMGIRLSVFAVLKIAGLAIGMVVICIAGALAVTVFLARRIGVSEKLGTLIAAGTSICGTSAIVATAPTIEADEEETAYAIATITIFGILAAIAYPYIAEMTLHLSVQKAGFFLGTSVHETAQVAATAEMYDQLWSHTTANGLTGAKIAITTKLVRNAMMIAVIPLLGFWYARKTAGQVSGRNIRITKYIPLFVVGYIIMAVIRSVGDGMFGQEKDTDWYKFWNYVQSLSVYIITVAAVCIGLNTNVKRLIKLGYRPFICGFIASFVVGTISFLLLMAFGNYLEF